ncbi:putative ribonuclease H-like domain-containing protein [Tanacetum coccineum]
MVGSDDEIPPPQTQTQTPKQQAPDTISTIKLLILKKGEYDIWAMKIEHYLAHTDYPIWEVIQRGNGPVSVSTDTNGVIKFLPPKTVEKILARERERKERTTLLMALLEDHLAKFHKMTDAKEMWEAIKSRFGGNDKSKKMQKYILKQQLEGFSVSNSEGLHKGYDRTKPGVDSLSFDDLYNNLRVFEPDVKGSTTSSSSTQNVAFVSENTSSTNEVSTAYGASSSSGHNPQREGSSLYTDELMYSFFANQSSGPQLDHEDLEQLDEFDLEEMDLKWQVAMISMRLKKFYKKTGRKLQFDAKEPVGFDKAKVECYNCHKTGHFARECRSKGNQDSRRRDAGYTRYKAKDSGRRPRKQEEPKALVTLDGEGVDWTSHSEDEQENYALMAYSNSGSDTDNKLKKKKEELKAKVEKCHNSSKNLNILLTSQMSARDKARLGEETLTFMPEPVVNKPKVVSQLKVWSDAPIIEEYELDSDDEHSNEKPVDQEDQAFLDELERLKRQQKEATDAAGVLRKDYDNHNDGIFTNASYDDEGAVADFTNLETIVNVSPIPTSRIHFIHPSTQILGDPNSAVLTRSKVNKSFRAHAFVSYIQKQIRNNHKDFQHCLFACFLSQIEPTKISEALEDENFPYGKKEIGTKWVYINKKDERGVVVRNKARIEAIRIFLAFSSYMGFIVYQMDMKSAFLYGKIDEEVYVSQPPGFVDPKCPKKSGYRRRTIDKTLFIKKDKNDIMLVQVYVDDIIFGSTKRSWCDEFEALMKSRFQMSSMGELTFFLGLQVKQKEDGIFISQDKYVAEILKKFDFASVKTASTPIETQKPLVKDEEATDVDVHLYRSMIGSLMYLTASRPDIMFAVCACSRFQVTPKTSHLNAVKRIFRYLKGKPKLGLWYPRVSSFDLEAYSDSDYAGANLDRKSTTGGCQFLGRRLISWQCKKQTIVATSTTEAEYVAAANCCGQVLWIQNQMLDYGFNFMNTKIYIDNESTICIVKNPVFHSKTKHIEIRHHFIRDAYEKKLIQVLKIHTDDNVADLLTKAFDVSSLYGMFCEQKNLDNGDVFHRVIWVLESN